MVGTEKVQRVALPLQGRARGERLILKVAAVPAADAVQGWG